MSTPEKSPAPVVFVSHASEDKERFVLSFATRLRAEGVDAWFDKWEIQPGDSLVDRIFEEGIKTAKAVIIVLSEFSVNKPWVREELNISIVRRIQEGLQIIPVVIGKCEVPIALSNTLWVVINDLTSYDSEFERILSAIFGLKSKPPLGAGPAYAQPGVKLIAGLNRVDSIVLTLACEAAMDGGNLLVSAPPLQEAVRALGVSEKDFEESIQVLGQRGEFTLHGRIGRGPTDQFRVSEFGFESFVRERFEDYEGICNKVIAAVVNQDLRTNVAIADAIGENRVLVAHILKQLEHHGDLTLSNEISTTSKIAFTKPTLSRRLV